jgi:hypothetical protein
MFLSLIPGGSTIGPPIPEGKYSIMGKIVTLESL